jgi:hypothetical protein
MSDTVSISEACSILSVTKEQLLDLTGEFGGELTTRHLLAAKIAIELSVLTNPATAVRSGITAGQGARVNGGRMLVVAYPDGVHPEAFWRDAHADFSTKVPFVAVPADLLLTTLVGLVADHRRNAARMN